MGDHQGDTSVWPLCGLLMTFKKQVYGKVWVNIRAYREAYRRLRANMIKSGVKSIGITSPMVDVMVNSS
tara:strand:- start:254 stop:460 length:207 start_codon:yes stop_codon:yes gene_type:complete